MSKEEVWDALTKEYLATEQKLDLIRDINADMYDRDFKEFLDNLDPEAHPEEPGLGGGAEARGVGGGAVPDDDGGGRARVGRDLRGLGHAGLFRCERGPGPREILHPGRLQEVLPQAAGASRRGGFAVGVQAHLGHPQADHRQVLVRGQVLQGAGRAGARELDGKTQVAWVA